MQHFVYLWMDKTRNMFYIGSHSGSVNDGYISSSRWLSGEVRYRPQSFKRRILSYHSSANEALREEHRLLTMIQDQEFGVRYYNIRTGRHKGCIAYNKGKQMSQSQKQKISMSKRGAPSPHRGKSFPDRVGQLNGMSKVGAREKLSIKASGRRMVTDPSGTRHWAYPGDVDYPA